MRKNFPLFLVSSFRFFIIFNILTLYYRIFLLRVNIFATQVLKKIFDNYPCIQPVWLELVELEIDLDVEFNVDSETSGASANTLSHAWIRLQAATAKLRWVVAVWGQTPLLAGAGDFNESSPSSSHADLWTVSPHYITLPTTLIIYQLSTHNFSTNIAALISHLL